MVTLLQSSCAQSCPDVLSVDLSSHLRSDLQVSAFNGKIESSLRVLNEVESNFGVSLLLQVSDNALSNQVTASNDLQDLIVVLPDQSKLEPILGRINRDCPWFGGSVQAVNDLSLDSGKVDGLFEILDDTIITGVSSPQYLLFSYSPIGQSVFDVVQSGVNEDTAVVPSCGFDSDSLVNQSALS